MALNVGSGAPAVSLILDSESRRSSVTQSINTNHTLTSTIDAL